MKARWERWEGEREDVRLGESAAAFSLFPSRAYYFLRLLLWDGCEGVSMSKKLSLALLVIVFTAETKIRTLGTRCTGKK